MSSKRVRFITIAGVLFAALVIGASLIISRLSIETRRISLPDTQAGASVTGQDGTDAELTLIEVTTDTVQDVIASLLRPVSYSRQIGVVNYYDGGSSVYTIDVYVLEDAKSIQIDGAGSVRHVILTGGMRYVWEDGDKDWFEAALDVSADETKLSNMSQMLLTYEDILEVAPERISYAGYIKHGDEMCIVVRYTTEQLQYLTTCYISVKSGLLIAAEQYDGDTLVYSMSASGFTADFYDTRPFELPDGTNVLGDI